MIVQGTGHGDVFSRTQTMKLFRAIRFCLNDAMHLFTAWSRWFVTIPMVLGFATSSCSKRVPNEVDSFVEANLPIAIQVAEDGAKLCSSLKAAAPFNPNPLAAPPPPPSPATGTKLATDSHVVDVLVMCSWPDPRDKTGNTGAGTSFPALKNKVAVPVRAVTMPEDNAINTCKKNADHCERIIVPSRYLAAENTADIHVTRKTVDGTIEVTVVIAP